MATVSEESRAREDQDTGLVDCDIHIPTDGNAVRELLPKPFRSRGTGGPGSGYSSPIGVTRRDAIPDEDTSHLELLQEKVLDPLGVTHGIITGGAGSGLVAYENVRQATAIATAYNEWVIDAWARADDRLYASIGIAPQDPAAAAAEIHRWGDTEEMVQVILGSGTRAPIGERHYWPIYEAAVEHDLPVAMHIGPKGNVGIGHANNPAGTSVTYGEGHVAQSINYYGQLASLVCEGVFEEFPELTFVLIEGEFGWVPDLMWRLDRFWRADPNELPWLTRPPAEYILDHVKFTTQPILEPPQQSYLTGLLEMIAAERTMMFCTDYPHWDGDYTPQAVFPSLDPEMRRAIFYETAADLYGFA